MGEVSQPEFAIDRKRCGHGIIKGAHQENVHFSWATRREPNTISATPMLLLHRVSFPLASSYQQADCALAEDPQTRGQIEAIAHSRAMAIRANHQVSLESLSRFKD